MVSGNAGTVLRHAMNLFPLFRRRSFFFQIIYVTVVHANNQIKIIKVLCPHREALYDRWMFDDFFNALTDGNLRAAEPVNIAPYEQIDTCQATLPHDQVLVFDWAKSGL